MTPQDTARWLPVPPDAAALPVFCIPFAGGGPGLFRGWQNALPASLQLCPVALPGREKRLAEPPAADLDALLDTLCALVEERAAQHEGRGLALYGHCFGGALAFELARRLEDRGADLRLLAVSGCRAPHVPPPIRIAGLPDGEFTEALRRFRLTPETVLGIPELLALFLPALRADFALDETLCASRGDPPLKAPVLVMQGEDDDIIPWEACAAWEGWSEQGCEILKFAGGHVFFTGEPQLILREIAARLVPEPDAVQVAAGRAYH